MSRLGSAIFELASEHDGVFTAAEAIDAGISHEALAMSARRGTVRRLSRGIYRLVAYPSNEEQVQLWEAVLWPTTRRGPIAEWGVLSHLTALRLNYTLLEYTPPKVSITISPALRIRRTPPAWLDIHRADLPDEDVTSNIGPPVTTLERTLRDCIDAGVERRLLLRVIEDTHLSDVMPAEQIAEFRERIG
jgi:predicted transcriptional regulator of viral defense system